MMNLIYNVNNEFFEEIFLKKTIKELLKTLTPQESEVITLRFGLDDGRTRTLKEVGKELNVSQERIRQVEAKALRKLRHPSRSKKIEAFIHEERFVEKNIYSLTEEGKEWVIKMEKYDPKFRYYEKDGSLFYISKHIYIHNEIAYVEEKVPEQYWHITKKTEAIYCK